MLISVNTNLDTNILFGFINLLLSINIIKKMKSLQQYITESAINERKMGEGWQTIYNDDKTLVAYMLAFDKPSQYGIDKGKISKLEIERCNVLGQMPVVCCYDRGWEKKPDKYTQSFYDEIIQKYN